MLKDLQDDLMRLKRITKDCRDDMHEPDEQEVTAFFGPSHHRFASGGRIYPVPFDNAVQTILGGSQDEDMGFWLQRTLDSGAVVTEWFNLASIVALARAARIE